MQRAALYVNLNSASTTVKEVNKIAFITSDKKSESSGVIDAIGPNMLRITSWPLVLLSSIRLSLFSGIDWIDKKIRADNSFTKSKSSWFGVILKGLVAFIFFIPEVLAWGFAKAADNVIKDIDSLKNDFFKASVSNTTQTKCSTTLVCDLLYKKHHGAESAESVSVKKEFTSSDNDAITLQLNRQIQMLHYHQRVHNLWLAHP